MENMRMIQEKRKKMRSQLEEAYRQQDEEVMRTPEDRA